MKSVNLAVQLRLDNLGQCSGALSELLGMGQNIITSPSLIGESCENYVYVAPVDATVDELAGIIKNALFNKKEYNNQELLEKYSFDNLGSEIKLLLEAKC
jgi:hypothetical protein